MLDRLQPLQGEHVQAAAAAVVGAAALDQVQRVGDRGRRVGDQFQRVGDHLRHRRQEVLLARAAAASALQAHVNEKNNPILRVRQ